MGIPWGTEAALAIANGDGRHSVEGLAGWVRADVRLGPANGTRASLVARPLVAAVGPFDAEGVIALSPFRLHPERRLDDLVEFERRIGRLYYDYMAEARWRYGCLCELTSDVPGLDGALAEVYSIDAASRVEARALDDALGQPPKEMLDIYADCSDFKAPGRIDVVPDGWIWLVPDEPR